MVQFFPYSDYDGIFIEFTPPSTPKRGPGYWKLNTSILGEQTLQSQIKSFWSCWQSHKPDFGNLIWWDKGKLQMKDICWKFSKARAKAHKAQQKLLEKELEILLSFLSTENTVKQISEMREKLGTIHRQLVASVKIRSKDHFYNDNKKSTKYFFSLDKGRQSQKNITKLIDDEGNVHTGEDQILKHIAEFYTKLYTEEPVDAHMQQKLLDSRFTDVCLPM